MAFSRLAWMVVVTAGCFGGGAAPPADGGTDGAQVEDAGASDAANDVASDADAEAGPRDFDWIYANVFAVRCGVGNCHGNITSLDLADGADTAYDNLLHNMPAIVCEGLPPQGQAFVVPGDASTSNLYLKLTGTTCQGTRMPLDAPPLPQDQIDTIRAWILSGAPR